MKILFLILISGVIIFPQVKFDDYFLNKTLRLDYYHTGDKEHNSFSFDELKEEPYWGGSQKNLIDKFNYGPYKFTVTDSASGEVIYSKTYATLFHEWQTTDEAVKTVKSFSETIVFPFPKNKAIVKFYDRDKKNNLVVKWEYPVDPASYFIKTERNLKFPSFDVINSGDPSQKVDIVILPEGYTQEEMDMFKEDCKKFTDYLFKTDPFKQNKDKFNVRGIEAPSPESGVDIPAEHVWKKTLMNSSFYTFDLDRYLMTSDNKSVRDLAANAPYDQIYIIANSEKYGGGSIYNHYSMCIRKNIYEEYVFTHEFGHGFASLADEYYSSDVAYNDFYALDVEPLDPNLTTLKNFDSKWKNMVDKDTPIPTPNTEKYADKVGAFEGGGYVAKKIYRPKEDCTMKSISVNNFCPVCKQAISEMINFYAE